MLPLLSDLQTLLKSLLRQRYLVVLALMVFALYQFVNIAENVVAQDEITLYDTLIVNWIHQLATPKLTRIMVWITQLGGLNLLYWLWLVAMLFFLAVKNWKASLFITLSSLGGAQLMLSLKEWIHRARPVLGAPIAHETGYSFPSGHTTVSMCFYGALIYLLIRYGPSLWAKIGGTVFLMSLVMLVGLSRVYLGVHYPSDVLAGFCLGIFWICFCICLGALIRKFFHWRKSF